MSEHQQGGPQDQGKRGCIVVAGAGSIGCFIGGLLAVSGQNVTLLARPRIIDDIRAHGLTLSDFSGFSAQLAADQITLSQDPDCLASADLVLVTVKTGATREIAALIARHTPASTPVISLQNGLEAIATLRAALSGRDVRAAMVPFNVVPAGPGKYHRATSGEVIIEAGPGAFDQTLTVPGLTTLQSDNITAIQWGKLLINLTNALNALSGLTIRDMLLSRDWRHLMADQMSEALTVLRAAGLRVQSTTPLPAGLIPFVLRLPTPVFTRIAAQMLTVDPTARTSMAYDLMQGRRTEIDSLQGVIIDLGKAHGLATPICVGVARAIARAESAGAGFAALTVTDLRGML